MKTLAKLGALVLALVVGYFLLGVVFGIVYWVLKVAVLIGLAYGAHLLWCWAKDRRGPA